MKREEQGAIPAPQQLSPEAKTIADQHSFLKSVWLHFLPGFLMLAAYLIGAPLVMKHDFPSLFALVLAEVIILVPYGLLHFYSEGKKRNGRYSLEGVILYHNPIPTWQYFLLLPACFAAAAGVFALFSPLDEYLHKTLFSWLPSWYFSFSSRSRSAMIIMCAFSIFADGICGPLIEELYFRGYLMPRISRFGALAPAINALFFAMYHFWQPWNFPSLLGVSLVLAYSVWWKKNVRVSILTHCIMNTVGQTMGLLSLFPGN